MRLAQLTALALLLATPTALAQELVEKKQPKQKVVLTNCRVIPIAGKQIAKGAIVIEGDKILSVETKPKNGGSKAVTVDLAGAVVTPGMVLALTQANFRVRGVGTPASKGATQAADGFDPFVSPFTQMARAGFTTAGLAPPYGGVGGQGAIIRPGQQSYDAIEKKNGFLYITFSGDPRFKKLLEKTLKEAKDWIEKQKKSKGKPAKPKKTTSTTAKPAGTKGKPAKPKGPNPNLLPVMEALKGKLRVIAYCTDPHGLETLIKLLAPYRKPPAAKKPAAKKPAAKKPAPAKKPDASKKNTSKKPAKADAKKPAPGKKADTAKKPAAKKPAAKKPAASKKPASKKTAEPPLKVTLLLGGHCWRVAKLVAKEKYPVLLRPTMINLPMSGFGVNPLARFLEAGCEVALLPSRDGDFRSVMLDLGRHLRYGVPAETLLRGVTLGAARALGLDDRGVLAKGKRADLIVWNRDPLDQPADILMVIRGGKVIYQRDVQEKKD